MKKIGLICATLIAGLSLAGCNNLTSQQSYKASSSSSSSTKVIKHPKKHQKNKQNSSSSSSSVSSASSSNNQQASSQASSTQTSNASSTQASSQSNGDPHLADGTDVYDLPLSDPRNPDSYKQGELMDIAGDPKYQNPDGSMNSQGAALSDSIESTFHQPQQ